jgi:hypothetical protein
MQALVDELFAETDTNYDGARIVLPVQKSRVTAGRKVRLVTFAARGTPAPDPHLLAAKTAHNYLWQHRQKMRGGAKPKEVDELDLLAEEVYINSCQHVQESDVMGSIIRLPPAQPKKRTRYHCRTKRLTCKATSLCSHCV